MITHDIIINLSLEPGDALEIEWVDARYLSGWHDRPEILSWERDFNKHRSTGIFVFANDENLLFCETWSPPGWENKSVGGVNSIPLGSILGVWKLERSFATPELREAFARVGFGSPPGNIAGTLRGAPTEAPERLETSMQGSDDIAELALRWRRAERAYQRALTGELSNNADMALAKLAGDASKALRLALDERIADGEDR